MLLNISIGGELFTAQENLLDLWIAVLLEISTYTK
jgi:hypothetical protein